MQDHSNRRHGQDWRQDDEQMGDYYSGGSRGMEQRNFGSGQQGGNYAPSRGWDSGQQGGNWGQRDRSGDRSRDRERYAGGRQDFGGGRIVGGESRSGQGAFGGYGTRQDFGSAGGGYGSGAVDPREDFGSAQDVGGPSYSGTDSYGSQGYGGITQGNYQGSLDGSRNRLTHHDADYHQWRAEQIRKLDNDYHSWRDERYKKFSTDFDSWRKNRATAGSDATATGTPTISDTSGASDAMSGIGQKK
jgi:hypothetical protein